MRIERLRIDGFGRFREKELCPLASRVTVLYGPNEGGKSTLLAFIRAILFGFPSYGARSHYPPLAGGRHGGSVSVADRHGQVYSVRRFQGPRGGSVAISTESGEPLGEAILSQLLGSHPKDVFNNVFAFTIDELHSDDLLKDSKVNGQMYSTGIGATALPDALNELDGLRDDLFLNRGSTQEIYYAVNRIEEIDGKLQEVANNASEYGRCSLRLGAIEEEIADLRKNLTKIQARHRIQTQLRGAWGDWVDLLSHEQEVREIPAIDNFPPDGLDRLNRLSDRVRTAREEMRSANRQVTKIEAGLEFPILNTAILNHNETIGQIIRQRGAFDQSVHDLPERTVELAKDREALAETLTDLGSEWDEERLEAFDLSIAVREDIQGFQNQILQARENVERLKSASQNNAVALRDAEEDVKRQQPNVDKAVRPRFDESEISERRTLIRSAKTTFNDLNLAKGRVADFEFRMANSPDTSGVSVAKQSNNVLSWILIVVGIGLIIGSVVLGGPAMSIGILGGVFLIGIATHRFYANRSAVSVNDRSENADSDYAEQLNNEVDRIQLEFNEKAHNLNFSAADSVALDALEYQMDEEYARLNEWNRINEQLENLTSLKKRRELALTESDCDLRVATGSMETVNAGWRDWIQERQLRETFTPETVIELRAKVDQGKDRLKTVRERRSRNHAIETDIRQFLKLVEPLANEFGIEIDHGDNASVALAADKLTELRSAVQQESGEREAAERDLEDANANLQMRINNLNDVKAEIDDLLKTGGAADEEEFRGRHQKVQQRAQLERYRSESVKRLQRLSAPGEQFEKLKSRLLATDAETIEHGIGELVDQRSHLDERIQALYEERGAVETQIEALVGEEQSSALRMQRHVLHEQVRDYSRKWAIYTVAKNLLVATRREFEQERQPRVLRHAESYFRKITGGRYSTIYAPLGEQTITVTDHDGTNKVPSELSRGTREQLFLSLRFGLIKELGEQTEPLPVIVDEVTVNFDPDRAALAASAFVNLSESNQVLVFTCHPTTVEIFRAAAKQHHVEEFDVISLE